MKLFCRLIAVLMIGCSSLFGQDNSRQALPYCYTQSSTAQQDNYIYDTGLMSQLGADNLYTSKDLPYKPSLEDDNQRAGIFQRINFKADYVSSGGGQESAAISKFSLQAVFGLPCPTRKSPLLLTPYFDVTCLSDTPEFSGLPTTLYRTGVDIAWMTELNDRWGIYVYITPSVSSDFKTSKNAFRLPGGVVATYKIDSQWKLTLGAGYTSYSSWPVTPICGLTWTPNDDWRFELLIPRPRICRRINSPFSQNRYWLYLGGEYGAGTWATANPALQDDLLSYRDLRACLGIEKDNRTFGRIDLNAEIGISFWRKLYYDNSPIEYCPNPGVFARIQLIY